MVYFLRYRMVLKPNMQMEKSGGTLKSKSQILAVLPFKHN